MAKTDYRGSMQGLQRMSDKMYSTICNYPESSFGLSKHPPTQSPSQDVCAVLPPASASPKPAILKGVTSESFDGERRAHEPLDAFDFAKSFGSDTKRVALLCSQLDRNFSRPPLVRKTLVLSTSF